MASKSLAPSLRLIPLNLLHFFCTYVASNQVFSHHWGQLRLKDEMSLLSTRQFVTSNRESLCTRREKGWSNYSLSCPPPGRLGFASHQRELLFRVPDPAPGTVLLRQELAACCATDAHTYLGQWPAGFPVILGHENVGIVEAIGPGGALAFVGRAVQGGGRVLARTGCCGTCYECRVAHQPRRCRNLRVRYGVSRAQDAPLSGGYGQYLYLSSPQTTFMLK